MQKKMTVIELFAGVGGFRIGLEKTNLYKVIWSNQYEPKTKVQHASMVYENVFGKEGHVTKDIHLIPTSEIPNADILVGGFPCQDYSVATSLKNSKGIEGKKGVLWWEIIRIIDEKTKKPKFLILENVDRLLKSPTTQRGRDFAIMLKSLEIQGYAVEWRVINAADYGFPQRRRRVFLIGYYKGTNHYKRILKNPNDWAQKNGVLSLGFPIKDFQNQTNFSLKNISILGISKTFNYDKKKSPFNDTGLMIDGKIITFSSKPDYNGKYTVLKDILDDNRIEKEFYISNSDLSIWKYLKGSKSIERITKEGHKYKFSEGNMVFPDDLGKPSRTIITGEGGISPSRFKHVIDTKKGFRRLTPIELERLNGFPDNHTKLVGISNTKRAFFMGNALVTGIITIIGNKLK